MMGVRSLADLVILFLTAVAVFNFAAITVFLIFLDGLWTVILFSKEKFLGGVDALLGVWFQLYVPEVVCMAVYSTLGGSEAGWLPNFERLVLGCMESYDSEKGRTLQHFSRSTRFAFLCTAPNSNLQSFALLIFAIFFVILQNFAEFSFN